MPLCNVSFHDGGYFVELGKGARAALRCPGGGPLPLLPGWVPKRVCMEDSLPIRVLELENERGQEAIWILDDELVFLTNNIEKLSGNVRQTLDKCTRDGLKAVWREFAISATPMLDPQLRWLNDLAGAARKALVGDFDVSLYPESDVHVLDDERPLAKGTAISDLLDRVWIRRLLETDLLMEYVSALDTGLLRLPSPVDGRELHTDIGYVLTQSVVAHRFSDMSHGLTFYAISGLWHGEIFALYLPTLGFTVYRDRRALGYSNEFLGVPVHVAIARHIFTFSHLIENYLQAPSRKPIVVYHQDHLGHHLWNELSGLDRIVKQVPATKLPDVYILGLGQSEMYGNVDQIFPELSGRVQRINLDQKRFIELSYTLQKHVLLALGQYVSRSLAQRIIDLNESAEEPMEAKRRYRLLAEQGFTFVMLGLRVENRTIVDLASFCIDAVKVLSQELGKVAIVVDGHNSVRGYPGKLYASHAERLANKPPAELESEIVTQLIARFKDDESIAILATIGAPVGESIYWCNKCEFFITAGVLD